MAEFEDHALLRAYGQAGTGIFPVPSVFERQLRKQDKLLRIGNTKDVRLHFYAISGERKIKNPAVAAICRRVKRRYGLGLIVIDYLQLIEPEDRKAPREQQVAQIARRLKFLAKELSVPVIALAQLNRGVELREDKRPRLADLRESGAIEQDADLVILIYREDAYNRDPNHPDAGTAELIVAKQRNGPTGTVQLTWDPKTTRFKNYGGYHGGGWESGHGGSRRRGTKHWFYSHSFIEHDEHIAARRVLADSGRRSCWLPG